MSKRTALHIAYVSINEQPGYEAAVSLGHSPDHPSLDF